MSCVHLQTLFQFCEGQRLRIATADLVRMVCEHCERDEVCPHMQMELFEAKHPDTEEKNQSTSELVDD
ncbi:MAG: hypothetical protein AAGG48_07085 [Planctomycetota bacterium]